MLIQDELQVTPSKHGDIPSRRDLAEYQPLKRGGSALPQLTQKEQGSEIDHVSEFK
jgi:hypothetical protein